MTTRNKTALKIVGPDLDQLEAVVVEAAQQTAPMVARFHSHRDQVEVSRNALMRERGDLEDRRELLRRQWEAADAGLAAHISDIDQSISLYEFGLNATTPQGD